MEEARRCVSGARVGGKQRRKGVVPMILFNSLSDSSQLLLVGVQELRLTRNPPATRDGDRAMVRGVRMYREGGAICR
jgi:hypothetical protein